MQGSDSRCNGSPLQHERQNILRDDYFRRARPVAQAANVVVRHSGSGTDSGVTTVTVSDSGCRHVTPGNRADSEPESESVTQAATEPESA